MPDAQIRTIFGLWLAITLAALSVSCGVKLARLGARRLRERAAWRDITRNSIQLELMLLEAWLDEQIEIRKQAIRRHIEGEGL